jgi:hypothetical protein
LEDIDLPLLICTWSLFICFSFSLSLSSNDFDLLLFDFRRFSVQKFFFAPLLTRNLLNRQLCKWIRVFELIG